MALQLVDFIVSQRNCFGNVLIISLPMEILGLEHCLGHLTGEKIHFKYSAKDFVRGGGNTPKGIYNQKLQIMFRKLLGWVMLKTF